MSAKENAELLKTAQAWRDGGRKVAVATVIKTWGSAPRPVGSRLIVADDGAFAGSVSGGCVEGAVADAAQQVMRSGATCLLHFGVADETAWEVGLSCGGEIEVFAEPFTADRADRAAELCRATEAREPRAMLTRISDGAQRIVFPNERGDENENNNGDGFSEFPPDAVAFARKALLRGDEAKAFDRGRARFFAEPFHPPRRMLLIGGAHIAQSLASLSGAAGFDAVVIDPRKAWASPERFPGAKVLNEWPDDALAKLGTDAGTALAALTHDPKIDDPALLFALRAATPPRYIGALGGRRTNENRRARLREEGIAEKTIARIHSPIGLDIGAKTAGEIALSVAAEIIAAFRAPQR